jgi:hypothetical protein
MLFELCELYTFEQATNNGFPVFMPSTSSATMEARGCSMTSKTPMYLEGRFVDRHLLLGALYTVIGLAGVWLLASYLSAIQ